MALTIHIFKDKADEWRFKPVDRNEEILFQSEGYKRRIDCMDTVKRVFLTEEDIVIKVDKAPREVTTIGDDA